MSVHVASKVWRLRLSPVEKLVMLKLADCADDQGRNAFPSVGTIAEEVGVNARTVQRALRELEARGLIEVTASANRYRPNCYRLHPNRGDILTPLDEGRGDTGVVSGVTNPTGRGDTAVSPDPSSDPSLEPSLFSRECAPPSSKPKRPKVQPANVVPMKAAVPLTVEAVAELRDRFGERVSDFDETIDFWRGDQRFRMQADKPAFLAKKLEERAQQQALLRAERRGNRGTTRNRAEQGDNAELAAFLERNRALPV